MIIPVAEVWCPVAGFPGYEVSDQGNVRTFRSRNGQGLIEQPRLIKPRPCQGRPYLRVTLADPSGKQVDRKVHILVLEAFKGPRPSSQHDARHGIGGATDNRLSNLQWGTKQENADDRQTHGTQLRGQQIHLSVLTDAQVAEVKAEIPRWKRGMCSAFAERFGVGVSAIAAIRDGKTWRHI